MTLLCIVTDGSPHMRCPTMAADGIAASSPMLHLSIIPVILWSSFFFIFFSLAYMFRPVLPSALKENLHGLCKLLYVYLFASLVFRDSNIHGVSRQQDINPGWPLRSVWASHLLTHTQTLPPASWQGNHLFTSFSFSLSLIATHQCLVSSLLHIIDPVIIAAD